MLIVFEGIDATGKSTQVNLLADFLRTRGKEVLVTHQPSGGSIGNDVYTILKKYHKTLCSYSRWLLHCAAHHQHWEDEIFPALEQGKVVLMDRWWWSAIAYSHGNDGVDRRVILDLENMATKWKNADLLFYFKNSKPFTLEDEIQDNSSENFRRNVTSAYEQLIEEQGQQNRARVIDTTNLTISQIFSTIADETEKLWR